MEAIVDSEGKPVVDSEGRPRVKTPKPRIELPYTYPMAWYVMHGPSLMTVVPPSKAFVPFVQKLESSSWSCYYMFFVRKSILSSSNYQLDRCFPEISACLVGSEMCIRDRADSSKCSEWIFEHRTYSSESSSNSPASARRGKKTCKRGTAVISEEQCITY